MSDEEFEQAGGNRSAIHVDFMIGSGELDVDGVLASGARRTADAPRRVGRRRLPVTDTDISDRYDRRAPRASRVRVSGPGLTRVGVGSDPGVRTRTEPGPIGDEVCQPRGRGCI